MYKYHTRNIMKSEYYHMKDTYTHDYNYLWYT